MVELVKNNGGHSLVLVFRMDTDQVENGILTVFSRVEQMENPEGKQFTVRFLQGFGK